MVINKYLTNVIFFKIGQIKYTKYLIMFQYSES